MDLRDVLTVAWLKRKRYEARVQAVEVVNALAIATSGEREPKRESGDKIMAQLGVTF